MTLTANVIQFGSQTQRYWFFIDISCKQTQLSQHPIRVFFYIFIGTTKLKTLHNEKGIIHTAAFDDKHKWKDKKQPASTQCYNETT